MEFDKIGKIILKISLLNCEIGGDKCQVVIIIIHNECIFLSNDISWFESEKNREIFLWPKNKDQKIIVSKFYFFMVNKIFILS